MAPTIVQPGPARIGDITQFLKVMALADHHNPRLASRFAVEIHVHAYPREPWVEHFEWLDPRSRLFNEHLEIADGRMHLLVAALGWASRSARA